MTHITAGERTASASRTGIDLYRAVWRWHFYAGLLVLPFMILLALTGALYLFKDEINDLVYRDLTRVEVVSEPRLPASALAARALQAHPGTLHAYRPPTAPDRAAQFSIAGSDGRRDAVSVDPYTGLVLGSVWDGGAAGSPLMWTVRKLHSLEIAGWWGNRIIEAVAGWAIVLVVTGIYLWWPRNHRAAAFRVKAKRGRPLWRDIHAVTGIYTAGFIAFLALSGLPWSGFWGSQFYDLSAKMGLGLPEGYAGNAPTSTIPTAEALDRAPWILEKQPMPTSTGEGVPVGLDRIVATVEARGIHPGYALNMPRGAEGVFTASVYPDDVRDERVIHLDQYSGDVLFDMGLADLGALGAAAEWGVGIHMGQAFGLLNQLVLLGACLAIVLMSVSAAVMWWSRRPALSLGVPPMPARPQVLYGLVAILAIGGIVFPLVGVSLIVMVLVDLLVIQPLMRPRSARTEGGEV
ncbi:PepSY domain-containing protein [Acuticoccus sp. M5D2P5]|uniref:PepSY-associated TM helix domain-containing protein n=1 Tax=Acuticoccus kalidii TaxID=2910977 RepID=UPI001F32190F|nr:PepSY domain-containing protein [Acuticoccus kalidii]MCF3934554.1 PepSY domain-containing protein [Acuticoccus kalidii]